MVVKTNYFRAFFFFYLIDRIWGKRRKYGSNFPISSKAIKMVLKTTKTYFKKGKESKMPFMTQQAISKLGLFFRIPNLLKFVNVDKKSNFFFC